MPGNSKRYKNIPKDKVLNDGEISLTSKEYESNGLNASKLTRGMDDCIEKGFVKLAHHGGHFKGDYNLFSISNDWKRYGEKDFEVTKRPKAVGYGFCSKGSKKKKLKN